MNPLASGTVVDRYSVVRALGAGGTARVYEVRHLVLDTAHALKVLHVARGAARERLVREGRLQAMLDPDHVVPVTDVIEVRGAPALIMPLVEGCSLDRVLAVYRPTEAEAVAVFAGIVAGVRSAHRAGVVHRDLKPANVLLDFGAGRIRVRVADFGVAKALVDPPSLLEPAPRAAAAGVGASTVGFVGTPAYAAPEQLQRPEKVDRLADLWSLGVILYEMLTGRRPGDPPELEPVPEPLHGLILGLLQIDPSLRTPSVEALAAELERIGLPDPGGALEPVGPLGEAVRACRASPPLGEHELSAACTVDVSEPGRTSAPDVPERRHHLPRERDAFVGREIELESLERRIEAGARLLTVVGVGGVGKTRLAVRLGWRGERRPGGTFLCDLAGSRTAADLALAVGRALDVPLGAADPVERLGFALRARGRCLVVLDGFEALTPLAEQTVGRWLDAAAEAIFLVTSRERLRLSGEEVIPLGPLGPDDAARLFVDRARAVGFSPGEDDQRPITELVRMLDGLPLAIELAAARTTALGPAALLERMEDRFRLLVAPGRGRGTTTSRWATLRAALDWSWSALDPVEQEALGQLAVFEGGFDLEAAEAVLSLGAGGSGEPPWSVDVLQALVDRSLVQAGGGRFALLNSVRDYAREKLAARAGEPSACARHGRHFARYGAPEALDALHRRGGEGRRRALALELPNLIAACRSAVERGDGATAAATATAAWQVLLLTGPPDLGCSLLESALPLAPEPKIRGMLLVSAGLARVLVGDPEGAEVHTLAAQRQLAPEPGARRELGIATAQIGVLRHRSGRLEEAIDRYEQALVIAREVGNRPHEANLLRNCGAAHGTLGRSERARDLLEQALALHRALGDRRAEALARSALGLGHLHRYELAEADLHLSEALLAYREVGDRRHVGLGLGNLGVLSCVRGEMDEANARCERALSIHREVGERRHEGQELGTLGAFAWIQGRLERARALLEEALVLHRALGVRALLARDLGNLGNLHLAEGRLAEARAMQDQALALARETGERRLEGEVMANLGRLALAGGDLDQAQARFEQGLAIASESGHRSLEGDLGAARGDLDRRLGRYEQARERLDAALGLLSTGCEPTALGVALCAASALDRATGALASAERRRAEAEAIAARIGAGPRSPLGRALS